MLSDLKLCQQLAKKFKLPIKVLSVEYHENGEITFHFSAKTRVDFRQLVRELQKKLHTKVILHQTTPRQQAQCLGGIGPCGQVVCCKRFLKKFPRLPQKLALLQKLGFCGQPMCCLSFESSDKKIKKD
jgi:cell fate regulator YaaT (PSP1 superfamily)